MSAHTCCASVYGKDRWDKGHVCGKKAKFERDGKHYCGTHDPVAVEAKSEARNAKWREEWSKESDIRRVEKAAPDLLAALQTLVAEHGGTIGAGSDHPYAIAARAAILKATGVQS